MAVDGGVGRSAIIELSTLNSTESPVVNGQIGTESEENFRRFFEKNASVMILVEPGSGQIVSANIAASKYYGYPLDQLIGLSINQINTLKPEDVEQERQKALREERNHFNFAHRLASGEVRQVEVYSTPFDIGNRTVLFSIVHDVTERMRAEFRLRLAASVFSHAREGIMISDTQANILEVNDSFTRITGYNREEAVGQKTSLLKSGRHDQSFYQDMWKTLTDKGHWYGEIWNRNKRGELYAEMLTITAVCDEADNQQHYVALFTDITTVKEHQQQLEHIAHYDALTNLPNRVLLADRLLHGITQCHRRNQSLAVVYLDLDGFKHVNDIHGHVVGDELLVTISQRMKAALREGDTLARIGGDEFVAVLVDLERPEDCQAVLDSLLIASSEPFTIGDVVLKVSASIGVTFFPRDGDNADLLLRHADQAMYLAKQSGKNRYHLFDAVHDAAVKAHYESVSDIRRALDNREFVLYYQPKVNMTTGEVIGVEGLIRWQHPTRGLLLPGEFLPVIEDHPLAIELGEWVIDTALSDIGYWQATGLKIPASVNVGARQLQQKDFLTRLLALLAAHPDVKPELLELEILETSAIHDMGLVSDLLNSCCEIGVRIALDDFGTGFSSLTYLKRLPAHIIKIDQSFVRNMLIDQEDHFIVDGVVKLAAAFKRSVIAEGVETINHGNVLLSLGCVLAQGYGVARPMPASDFPAWLSNWRPDAAWIASAL